MSRRVLVCLVVLGLALAACGGSGDREDSAAETEGSGTLEPAPETTSADPVSSTTSATAAPDVAEASAPFDQVVPTVDGGEVDLAEFAGRDVIVWFWAPW